MSDTPVLDHIGRCPVCGSDGRLEHDNVSDRSYFTDGRWQIMDCTACRTAWLHPPPAAGDMAQYYDSVAYYTHHTPERVNLDSHSPASILRRSILSSHKHYVQLRPKLAFTGVLGAVAGSFAPLMARACYGTPAALVPRYRAGGKLLDVGCGSGAYLSLMQSLGWDIYGIEPDSVAADLAHRHLGCPIHNGTLDDCLFPAAFDVVVASHVIEHTADPALFIRKAARLLKPKGQLILLLPNIRSLGHRVFGTDWYPLDPPRHLTMPSPRAFRTLMDRTALFDDIRVTTLTRQRDVTASRAYDVRKTGGFFIPARATLLEQTCQTLFSVVEAAGNGMFAWGEEIICMARRKNA